MKRKRFKLDFATILHLAEVYAEQYNEKGYCMSPEENDLCFRDFVQQYTSAVCWNQPANPVIRTDIPF